MSFAPIVPPLPQGFSPDANPHNPHKYSKPPIPPLPLNFIPREDSHLAAPMPERAMPSLPADISRTLDDSLYSPPSSRSTSLYPGSGGPGGPGALDYRRPSPAPNYGPGYGGGFGPPPAQQGQGYGVGAPPGQLYAPNVHQSPPPGPGYPGGFARPPSTFTPPRTGPSPAPPSYAGGSGGFAPPQANPGQYSLSNAMGAMSLGQQQRPTSAAPAPYPSHAYSQQQPYPPPQQAYPSPQSQNPTPRTSPSQTQDPPTLTAPLPTPASLTAAQRALPTLTHPPYAGRAAADHMAWIRDVVLHVEHTIIQQRTIAASASPDSEHHASTTITLHAPLPSLLHSAISTLIIILSTAPVSSSSAPGSLEPHVPEALYLKGMLCASDPYMPSLASPHPSSSSRHSGSHSPHGGSNFEGLEPSPRLAFQAFSSAARLGYLPAWFKLGRDYELVGDVTRARDCFERGAGAKGEVGCLYRLGMAHLLGQISFTPSSPTALPLLQRAALLATPETPQPAYVYGLILLDEFDRAKVGERVLNGLGLIPRGSSPLLEARRHIERAAYLGFAPAQYKLGHAYEYAVPPFPFDPLLSVQYYSLASQQGESEADMALSKWFLCGADGAFEKDEALAVTFAEKAAHKGLGSAEFAMGYYAEVGVGGLKDIVIARKWYAKAVSHGNPDAPDRLRALSQPAPQALSRTEHDAITDAKLVRTRTQARVSAQQEGRHAKGRLGLEDPDAVVQRMKVQAQDGTHHNETHGQGGTHGHEARPLPQQPQLHFMSTPPLHMEQPQISPSRTRYSLVDSPAPAGLPNPPAPSAQGRAAGRPPGRRNGSNDILPVNGAPHHSASPGPMTPPPQPMTPPSETRPTPRPAVGASTFEEMGFKAGKAEEKECVIM